MSDGCVAILFIGFAFLSCFVLYSLQKLSLNAFDTTQKLERLIAAAPNIGLSVSPSGINTPGGKRNADNVIDECPEKIFVYITQ